MLEQQKSNVSTEVRGKRTSLTRLFGLFIAFLAGAACMYGIGLISRKAEVMGHPYKAVRLINLAGVTRRGLGLCHLRSCKSKVQRLHDILASTTLKANAKKENVEAYLASILIDGRSCNEFLVQHLHCRQKLPPFFLFSEIKSVFIFDMDFAPLIEDEQGLMLFLLHRINPQALLFSPEYFYRCCEITEEDRRSFLVSEWNYLYGKDAPPGIFERLTKKLLD